MSKKHEKTPVNKRYEALLAAVTEVFDGDEDKIYGWMNTKRRNLDCKRPKECINTDFELMKAIEELYASEIYKM